MSNREEGQILYSGTMRGKVDFTSFSGVLTNHIPEPSRWRVQIFQRKTGVVVYDCQTPTLPLKYAFGVWDGFSAIYTRVR